MCPSVGHATKHVNFFNYLFFDYFGVEDLRTYFWIFSKKIWKVEVKIKHMKTKRGESGKNKKYFIHLEQSIAWMLA